MLKLIIVEPKYQMNIGYIARVASNFGIQRLFIVNPRVNIIGNKAIMFSKHAHSLLENAKIYNDFDEAIKDCDIVIGTTGVLSKANPQIRKVYLAEDAAARASKLNSKGKRKNAVIGIVIGRDDTGLSTEELSKCDMVTYIGTNEKYPVLNISHALAIMLYIFTRRNFEVKYKASIKGAAIPNSAEYKKELDALLKLFKSSISKKRIRDKDAVYKAFKRMINNSQPTMHEIKTLIIAFK